MCIRDRPSFDSLFENWKPISAVIVAVMIAGGGAFYILGADSSFQARQLKYGDEMTFTIDDGMIYIEGDEMISLVRDAASPSALDEICDEISVDIVSGSGSSVMRKGSPSDFKMRGTFPSSELFHPLMHMAGITWPRSIL